jgi:hypothetical protein
MHCSQFADVLTQRVLIQQFRKSRPIIDQNDVIYEENKIKKERRNNEYTVELSTFTSDALPSLR